MIGRPDMPFYGGGNQARARRNRPQFSTAVRCGALRSIAQAIARLCAPIAIDSIAPVALVWG
jgi:hypothetical protein